MLDNRNRRGSALIEVIVALVLFATAGTGLVTLLGQTSHAVRSTFLSEQRIHAAAAELDRLVLLDQTRLRSHTGQFTSHGWIVDIRARGGGLFDVSIAISPNAPALLRTIIYRPAADTENVDR
jgi:Tfp pilus assembly protein PilV